MKRRIWIRIGAIALLIAVIGEIVTRIHANQDAAALAEQLRFARSEGIPTTWQEFAATIPTATPAENAAPLYRELEGQFRYKLDVNQLELTLIFQPTPVNLQEAKTFLAGRADVLQIADRAAKLPKCWFNRDWSVGPIAVLFPEFAYMKGAAKEIALRGSVAARENRPKDALADADRMFAIARHAGCEPTVISRLVCQAINSIAIRSLACWSFAYRDQSAYQAALTKAIQDLPRPDLKDEHREDVLDVLSVIDLSETPEGRKQLGIREEDVGAGEKIVPLLMSRPKAKVRLVEAERKYWDALGLPSRKQAAAIEEAVDERNMAMMAWPTALQIYTSLGGGEDSAVDRETAWEARKQQLMAIARALSSKTIPKSIDTSDLRSPFNGKPLTYRYDGRQIVVTVSGYESDSKPIELKIPPDKALAKSPTGTKPTG